MGQILHGSARTTEIVRRKIQASEESIAKLAERYDLNPKTVQKWKNRTYSHDSAMGPKEKNSTVLTVEEEASIVVFRKHTLLPLDDCLYALQDSIPHLTRSSLHRCLQRHGISRLPDTDGEKKQKKKFKQYRTNGQVDTSASLSTGLLNRTIKEATTKRYHYDSHEQLKQHLYNFINAYNFAKRLKTLKGLTPYEYIISIWKTEPNRFKLNPIHHTAGLNIYQILTTT